MAAALSSAEMAVKSLSPSKLHLRAGEGQRRQRTFLPKLPMIMLTALAETLCHVNNIKCPGGESDLVHLSGARDMVTPARGATWQDQQLHAKRREGPAQRSEAFVVRNKAEVLSLVSGQ